MKFIVRTLQQTQHELSVGSNTTILEVKEMLKAKLPGEPDAARLRLIHTGRILQDNNKTLEEYGIKDGDFAVVMVTPSVTPAPVSKQPEPSSSSTSTNPSAAGSNTTSTTAQPSVNPSPMYTQIEAQPGFNENMKNIIDMGYPEDQVLLAMRAAYGNPDRAVQYLLSGLPEENRDDDVSAEGILGQDLSGDQSLDFLRQDPQFRMIRRAVQHNPELLPQLLNQIKEVNPAFYDLIETNKEAFIELMNEDAYAEGEGEEGEGEDDDLEGEGEELSAGVSGGQQANPGIVRIEVNEHERAAIERLCSLGFDRARVLEAYLACDKNEELAANFLLEHQNDD